MTLVPFNLLDIYPSTESISELISQVDDLKKCLDSFRPLSPEQAENLQQVFDTEYTYDSNRIEGNTLTLQETALVLEKGVTIGGKPLKEHLEVINHQEAIGYIRDIVNKDVELDERALKDIHAIILKSIDRKNAGAYRRIGVMIRGSKHRPPEPHMVAELMDNYFAFYRQNNETMHPVLLAADMHEKLVTIHPFVDGNGRSARMLMNLILLQQGYPVANISSERDERQDYYTALEAVQTGGSIDHFHRVVLKAVKTALIKYLDVMSPDVEEGKGDYYLERIAPHID
ncbi:MAG: Fic family protein [Deltaproteobacteria bacterium]|nr:Fic family protein [Deltaproteobacteria bacterium]